MHRPTEHDAPAFMTDLDNVKDGKAQWNKFISTCFAAAIADLRSDVPGLHGAAPVPQFFDITKSGPETLEDLVEQPIVWNAFPRALTLRLGREWALVHADTLWAVEKPILRKVIPRGLQTPGQQFLYRPQDEYCEWRVERDAATGNIRRITFTCEPPEYWTALFGGFVRYGRAGKRFAFAGNPEYATELYRELTGEDVRREDLALPDGSYNRFNRWNSTHGIIHLSNWPNSISAEVQLAADGTVLRKGNHARLVTNPAELICCAGYGEADRNSDPTIGAASNALARLGARVTLANPVGIYMDNLDVSGWSLPDGTKPADCWRRVRGRPDMMERIVVEVPPETGLTVSDLSIGGEPVRFGGQVAECITIKLLGWGDIDVDAPVRNGAAERAGNAYLARLDPAVLTEKPAEDPPPAGMRTAFGPPAKGQGVSPRLSPFYLPPTHATRRRT